MRVGTKVTYGRLPYWKHNGHTATVQKLVKFEDGTCDCTWLCDCDASWTTAVGVDHTPDD